MADMTTTEATGTARERSRSMFRSELAREAVELLVDRGFSSVTVDEIARHIGVSRATFFRYFGSKEDVVVVSTERSGAEYAEAMLSSDPDQATVWTLLRAAFEPAAASAERDPDRLRARLRMINADSALKARIAEKRSLQLDEVATALASRIGNTEDAYTYTVAAYAVIDLTWERWATSPGTSFTAMLDDAFAVLARH